MAAQPATPTTATLDAEGRIAVDAPCVQCGYNLRTLKLEALCPECAQPVAYSVQGYFLRFASPRWVKGLAHGVLLVLLALGGAVILGPLLAVVFSIPMMLNTAQNAVVPSTAYVQSMAVGQFVFQAIVTGVGIAGLVYLTRREPGAGEREAGWTAQRLIRICCWLLPIPIVLNLVDALCMPALQPFPPSGPPSTPASVFGPGYATYMGLSFAAGIVATLLYAVAPLALLRHLTGLLRRLPRPGLVRFARVEFWGLLACAAALVLGYTLMAVTMLPTVGPLMAAASSMPTTMPGSTVTTSSVSWSARSVSVTQIPVPVPTAGPGSIPASVPAGSSALVALGYATPATASAPTTLPTTWPAGPPFPTLGAGFYTGLILGGGTAALGGCGSIGFGIAAIVLLVMACAAFSKAGREAEGNALSASGQASGENRT
jgi:hypothetical protein